MNKYIMITTTFDDEEAASKVIKTLLNEKLVSCCQCINIRSSYHWHGKTQATDEILVQMKNKERVV